MYFTHGINRPWRVCSSVLCFSLCRKANMFVSFFVDIALGLLLISWLYRENRISQLANTLVPAADVSTVYTRNTKIVDLLLTQPYTWLLCLTACFLESETGGLNHQTCRTLPIRNPAFMIHNRLYDWCHNVSYHLSVIVKKAWSLTVFQSQ